MANQYRCKQSARLELVKENGVINAIDFLDVLDRRCVRQRGFRRNRPCCSTWVLAPGGLTAANVSIVGGGRGYSGKRRLGVCGSLPFRHR